MVGAGERAKHLLVFLIEELLIGMIIQIILLRTLPLLIQLLVYVSPSLLIAVY